MVPPQLVLGAAALVVALLVTGLTVNRLVRRKLRLTLALLGLHLAGQVALLAFPALVEAGGDYLQSFDRLALSAGILNLLVVSLANPLWADRTPDRFPSILQDALVIGLLVLVATFIFHDKLLTTSAVGAVVVGFALQDTLGNAVAGLALQTEKPFHVGHWVRVGDVEGRVCEITWRAVRLRTTSGNVAIVPNSVVGKSAITNYSEPVRPMRIHAEVSASRLAAPNLVKGAIREAMAQVPRVLETPPPDVLLADFGESGIEYHARFWINEFETAQKVADQVRTGIYYAFTRRGIEIPWPIIVRYEGHAAAAPDTVEGREQALAAVGPFASLGPDILARLASACARRLYGDGETVVREGEPGASMFLVTTGRAAVVLPSGAREVAELGPGDYFGEMSLLTGAPRSASVEARGDLVVLEIHAEALRAIGRDRPDLVEQLAIAAVQRRDELDAARAPIAAGAAGTAPERVLHKIRRFLHLS